MRERAALQQSVLVEAHQQAEVLLVDLGVLVLTVFEATVNSPCLWPIACLIPSTILATFSMSTVLALS